MAAELDRGRRQRKGVVALSWPNFLDHMRENWAPGQHIALVGPTGEGKTTFAVGLLELRRWVLALDPKGHDDTLSASGYDRIESWPPSSRIRNAIAEGFPVRLIVGGHARTREEVVKLGETMRAAIEGVRQEGAWALYADEMQILADPRMRYGVANQIEELLVSARTRQTSVITAFQAPAWVPRACTRQATFCIVWGTRDRGMVKTVAESMGRDWRELQAMLNELPEFHVLGIPKRVREPLILTKAPKVS